MKYLRIVFGIALFIVVVNFGHSQEKQDSMFILLSLHDTSIFKFIKNEVVSDPNAIAASLSIVREKYMGDGSTVSEDIVVVLSQPPERRTYEFYSLKKPTFQKEIDVRKAETILNISRDKFKAASKYYVIEKLKEGLHIWEMYLFEIE